MIQNPARNFTRNSCVTSTVIPFPFLEITRQAPTSYRALGCWKDTANRAVPTLEGKDARLKGSYSSRDYAIDLCYQTAKAKGYHIFAVQNGGWCAGMRGSTRYQKYGKATNCKYGKGGSWANDVYQIGGKQMIR